MNKNLSRLVCMLLLASPALGYTIDGDLSDWGVTPFVDWVPDTGTVEYTEEDFDGTNAEPGPSALFPGGYPYGGEGYDIEAIYFDDAAGIAYFAIVLSIPESGYSNGIIPGDLALDIDNDPSTGEYGFEYGVKLTGDKKGFVCYNPDWTHPGCNPKWGWCDESKLSVMECPIGYSGRGVFVYEKAGVNDNGRPNYIIEGKVLKSLIGLPQQGDVSQLHAANSCGNDFIELEYRWDFPVPEFVSALVPLIVLLTVPTLAYFSVRFKA